MWSIEMHLINHLHIDIHSIYKNNYVSYKKPLLKKIESIKKKPDFFYRTYILIRG